MKYPKDLKNEIIKATLDHYQFNEWSSNLQIIVFDSEKYPVRDFSVVCDNDYNISYWVFDLGEAYWDRVQAPENEESLEISYIRHYDDDHYIFFDKNGKDLTGDIEFYKLNNMDRKILAKSLDGDWYKITLNGPVLDAE